MAIRIFGSKARGDADSYSDLDVFIMVAGLTKEEKRVVLDVVVELEVEHLCTLSTLILSGSPRPAFHQRGNSSTPARAYLFTLDEVS